MTLWQGSKAELVTAFAAAIGIPFYLGIMHTPVPQLALYSGVAGAAMATGELVEDPRFRRQGLRLFVADVVVWATVVGFTGGLAYLIALIF
jgi:hypothetical protein